MGSRAQWKVTPNIGEKSKRLDSDARMDEGVAEAASSSMTGFSWTRDQWEQSAGRWPSQMLLKLSTMHYSALLRIADITTGSMPRGLDGPRLAWAGGAVQASCPGDI